MKKRNQSKRSYLKPQSWPTEVAFEEALLVDTARFLFNVEESDNINATDGIDEEGGDLYFEL